MKENKTSRVSLNFPNKVIFRVKKFARKNGVTDTSAYIFLLYRGLCFEDDIIQIINEYKMKVKEEKKKEKEKKEKEKKKKIKKLFIIDALAEKINST